MLKNFIFFRRVPTRFCKQEKTREKICSIAKLTLTLQRYPENNLFTLRRS